TQVGQVKANNIVRVDKSTGAVSPLGSATQNGISVVGTVYALALIGSDLYVGGNFSTVSSSSQSAFSASSIAKWSTTTQTWSRLGGTPLNGVGGDVNVLVASGNSLFVGGSYIGVSTASQNLLAHNIARWDIPSQSWSLFGSATQNGTGSVGPVNALAVSGN